MNTFFKKKDGQKWTWISPDRETKNEIDFILTDKYNTVKDVTTLYKVNVGSDHRMVRCKIRMDQRRERKRLMTKKYPNLQLVKEKREEFSILVAGGFWRG